MPIFASVFLALDGAGVPFLVIGGHAVVLHGHLRNTFDLDLLRIPDALRLIALKLHATRDTARRTTETD